MPIIGRDPNSDIYLDSPQVSARHAEIVTLSPGLYRLQDLGSSNGTFVNGQRIQSANIGASDRINLGSYTLDLAAYLVYLDGAVAPPAQPEVHQVACGAETLVIGRDPAADIVIESSQVSGRHASVAPLGNGLFRVSDLGSTNGLFVRGVRIQTADVTLEDVLGLGSKSVSLRDYHSVIVARMSHPVSEPQVSAPPAVSQGPPVAQATPPVQQARQPDALQGQTVPREEPSSHPAPASGLGAGAIVVGGLFAGALLGLVGGGLLGYVTNGQVFGEWVGPIEFYAAVFDTVFTETDGFGDSLGRMMFGGKTKSAFNMLVFGGVIGAVTGLLAGLMTLSARRR